MAIKEQDPTINLSRKLPKKPKLSPVQQLICEQAGFNPESVIQTEKGSVTVREILSLAEREARLFRLTQDRRGIDRLVEDIDLGDFLVSEYPGLGGLSILATIREFLEHE